ncbi:hypothetical protein G4O51_13280 [Candidatus Bathyarchaeota archaeon A05DMB-2]|nr:hypothetical protein [Candidatus Bathyarchaeota archaeon A05DMB-2]
MKDSDYLLHYRVCTLLGLHGFKTEIYKHDEIFENIRIPVEGEPTEEDYKKYEIAINQLRKIFREKKLFETLDLRRYSGSGFALVFWHL